MKNLKNIFTIFILSLSLLSCDTDGGTSEIEFREGAIPDFTLNDDYPTILNLNRLVTGENIQFGFSVDIAQGDVASADVVAFYLTADGDTYGPVTLRENVSEFPTEIVLDTEEIIELFPELDSFEDFKLGDELLITTKLYLNNGEELDLMDSSGRLYGSDIHTATVYDVVANYPVGCPLDGKFTGSYRVTSTSEASPFGAFTESEFTVTLEETSQTTRTFDFTYLTDLQGFDVSPTLEFICDMMRMQITGAGIGCGGGEITFGSADDGVQIDPNDDSSFTITITDFVSDGNCGVGTRSVTLEFEKV